MMVRKKYEKKEILLAVGCVCLAIATLTFYIWHQASLISLGYQTVKLEDEIRRLEEEIKQLETRKSSLLALDRVEEIARDKLNLIEPQEDKVIFEEFRLPGER
jgi:cell division protein FtsL